MVCNTWIHNTNDGQNKWLCRVGGSYYKKCNIRELFNSCLIITPVTFQLFTYPCLNRLVSLSIYEFHLPDYTLVRGFRVLILRGSRNFPPWYLDPNNCLIPSWERGVGPLVLCRKKEWDRLLVSPIWSLFLRRKSFNGPSSISEYPSP